VSTASTTVQWTKPWAVAYALRRAGGDWRWLRYILKADGRPPQRERPPALEAVADWVRAFSNPDIALNADFFASKFAANTENT